MKTLLQIDVCCNWGSTGKIAEQIGLLTEKQGWTVYQVWGRHKNPSKLTDIKVGNMLGVYEHYAENILLDNEGLASRCATKELVKKIDKIKPDVVQLHDIHNHWLNYKILFEYLNSKKIPLVWTFHDCWAFTGHCYHFVSVNCVRWKTGCFSCPLRNRFCDQSRRNWNLKKSLFATYPNLTIVPVSQWMGDFVKESFLKDNRIEVIRNGVDLSVFQPQMKKKSGHFKVLAVSSVWNESKGIKDIYRLRELLPKEWYEIIVVGLSSEQAKSIPDGVTGIQRTQNVQELVQLYSDADVMINPTYADTFPTVNLEALACGTPVITYRTGGSPEAVDELTGAVVEQGNIEELCSKIIEFKNTGFKQLHSSDCRKRAEECFDKDKCFGRYVELYEGLLK